MNINKHYSTDEIRDQVKNHVKSHIKHHLIKSNESAEYYETSDMISVIAGSAGIGAIIGGGIGLLAAGVGEIAGAPLGGVAGIGAGLVIIGCKQAYERFHEHQIDASGRKINQANATLSGTMKLTNTSHPALASSTKNILDNLVDGVMDQLNMDEVTRQDLNAHFGRLQLYRLKRDIYASIKSAIKQAAEDGTLVTAETIVEDMKSKHRYSYEQLSNKGFIPNEESDIELDGSHSTLPAFVR